MRLSPKLAITRVSFTLPLPARGTATHASPSRMLDAAHPFPKPRELRSLSHSSRSGQIYRDADLGYNRTVFLRRGPSGVSSTRNRVAPMVWPIAVSTITFHSPAAMLDLKL